MTSCLGTAPPTVRIPATPSWCLLASLSVFLSLLLRVDPWKRTRFVTKNSHRHTCYIACYMLGSCWLPCLHQARQPRCLFKVCEEGAEVQMSRRVHSRSHDSHNSYEYRQASCRLPHPRDCLQLASVLGQPVSSHPPALPLLDIMWGTARMSYSFMNKYFNLYL